MSTEPKSDLHTRPTLLFRLRDWKDERSWTEFYRLYSNFVFGVARRAGLSHADADEVTQDVFKRVSETVHEFESNPERGTFRGWLLNLTRWRINDKFRARAPHERNSATSPQDNDQREGTIERLPDGPEMQLVWEREWQSTVLETAFDRLARKAPAKQFQAFDLYTRQHWPVLRIARELGMNPAAVYLIAHRLTKQLKAEAAQIQKTLR